MMASSTLTGLPHDITSMVIEELWEASPQSVFALGRTCCMLRNAAVPFLYRYLAINISTKAKISADVEYLRTSIVGQQYLRHCRHIKLAGMLVSTATESNEPESDDPQSSDESERRLSLRSKKSFKPGSVFEVEESLSVHFDEVFVTDPVVDDLDSDTAAWKPFVDLLRHFTRLQDFVWHARKRFPPGLVEKIQQHHPESRIHLRRFRFLSLHDSVTSPEELALANSPCLHSVSLLTVGRDSSGKDDHNDAAGLRLLTAAPRLKHFRFLGARPASSPQLYSARGRPRSVWMGFKPDLPRKEPSALQTFATLVYSDTLGLARLDTLQQHMAFASLRKAQFSVADANVLSRFVDSDMLRSLDTLDITLRRSQSDEGYKLVAEGFFSYLPRLRSLSISGTLHRQLLTSICGRHGETLHSLSIRPWIDYYDMAGPPLVLQADTIEEISTSCPHLDDADFTIRRTQGDNEETRCYEAMAKLHGLKSVTIHLDCSNRPHGNNRTLTGTTNDEMRRALVNSAVDETLARSIWNIITGADVSSRLETLQLTSGGGSSFGNSHPGDLMTIVNHISRSYTVKRVRKDESDTIEAVEISRERREKSDQFQRDHEKVMLEKWGHRGLSGAYHVMNELWGLEEGYGNWREAWKSFPLQRSDGQSADLKTCQVQRGIDPAF